MNELLQIPQGIEELYKENYRKVYPEKCVVFRALTYIPITEAKVLIIGQDPYHKPGQADGLAFSVPTGVKPPPSLRNIFKEIQRTVSPSIDTADGNLERWARQGVLLLNRTLTVEHGRPNSHKALWASHTRQIICAISNACPNLVVMLWGNEARALRDIFGHPNQLVLEWTHPSPLSRNPFTGNNHFIQANEHIMHHGSPPIQW